MVNARELFKKFVREEEAQGMTEYILIIGLIAVICVVSIKLFGTQIKNLITTSKDKLSKETAEVGK
ncbi:MAG: Flp family type IVb pilin [Elusimicrobia bacterium]|nr:Flp family type IVb pilin [Elusimicrobiota bacterium]MBU2615361.1 Flp family type IVb pilin [Elusimicrobiota bacterium]